MSVEELEDYIRRYYAMISFVDNEIGRIVRALETSGKIGDTLVVFTSDHGEYLGDHGLLMKGPWMYESVIRVPLIIAGPGVSARGSSAALIEGIDLLPTVAELTGAVIPYGTQGVSLLPILQNKKDAVRDSVLCVYDGHTLPIPVNIKSLITKRYKLSLFAGEAYGELFDLINDPQELNNLFLKPSAKEIKAELIEKLCHRLILSEDSFPAKEAYW
jgi:arylsulfatase A-like enzyme